jgi:hypothetical protein
VNRLLDPSNSRLGFRRQPRCSGCLLALGITILLGCGGRPTVAVSDPSAARRLLDETLQAWQSGKTVEELRQSNPPVYVAEDLWQQGRRLEDFAIDGAGEVFGTNIRLGVTLRTIDAKGKPANRHLTYLVTTTPANTIAREDR